MGVKQILLAPSLICSDLCNLEEEAKKLEHLGVDLLHVDILDGHFSPSMPLGLGGLKALKERVSLPFDVHLMVENNEFFINQMLSFGCERLCFHYESANHVDHLLSKIKGHGVKAGIALKPATPIHMLEDILQECDYVMLMLINPGYAGNPAETIVPYAHSKIQRLKRMIEETGRDISIQADGRITLENLPTLLDAGVDTVVCGTGTLFRKGYSLEENYKQVKTLIGAWEDGRKS